MKVYIVIWYDFGFYKIKKVFLSRGEAEKYISEQENYRHLYHIHEMEITQ